MRHQGVFISEKATAPGIRSYKVFAGYKWYELRVAMSEPLLKRIHAVNVLLEGYQSQQLARIAQPGLPVLRFQAREEMEGTLLRWINRIVSDQEGFRYTINNYGSVPGKPLYLRIQEQEPFQKLAASFRVLDGWLQGNGCGGLEIIRHPRVQLLESLDSSIELEVLLFFSGANFYEELELCELELQAAEPWMDEFRLVSRFPLLPPGFKPTII